MLLSFYVRIYCFVIGPPVVSLLCNKSLFLTVKDLLYKTYGPQDFEMSIYVQLLMIAVADPGLEREGGAISRQRCANLFCHFMPKVHENERIWTESPAPHLDPLLDCSALLI